MKFDMKTITSAKIGKVPIVYVGVPIVIVGAVASRFVGGKPKTVETQIAEGDNVESAAKNPVFVAKSPPSNMLYQDPTSNNFYDSSGTMYNAKPVDMLPGDSVEKPIVTNVPPGGSVVTPPPTSPPIVTPPSDVTSPPVVSIPALRSYTVGPVESWSTLASRFNIDMRTLINYNGGTGVRLSPGMKVNVPATSKIATKNYVIVPGDSWTTLPTKIGKINGAGIDMRELINLNGGTGYALKAGQTIKIPVK